MDTLNQLCSSTQTNKQQPPSPNYGGRNIQSEDPKSEEMLTVSVSTN